MLRPLAVALAIAVASPAGAAIISVGPSGDFATITAAVDAANLTVGSDTIQIAPGVYLNDFVHVTSSMVIQALTPGSVVLQATIALPNDKSIMQIDGVNASVVVDGLVFQGAAIADALGGNGAGIRDQQTGPDASLTVLNSTFRNNQNGILQGANNTGEAITISGSRFEQNGRAGSGQEHGIYINTAESLTVSDSYFCGEVGQGHLLKSRAAATTVTGSSFYDGAVDPANPGCGAGSSSYAIDLPNGGIGKLAQNLIVQGPDSPNSSMVAYGAEGLVYADNSLLLTGNTFQNTRSGGIGVLDPPCVPVQLSGNNFSGVPTPVSPPGCATGGPTDPPPTGINAPGSSLLWLGLALFAAGILGRNIQIV